MDDAQDVLVTAATLLDKQGNLSAGNLKQLLYEEHPDSYSTEDAMWCSTVERLYQQIPGFRKPEYGEYEFDRSAAHEILF